MNRPSKANVKKLAGIILLLYLVIILWLLFIHNRPIRKLSFPYLDYIKQNIQLIPFHTISEMFRLVFNKEASINARVLGGINVIGNILIMFPAGILVPIAFEKCREFKGYFCMITSCIVCIELLQLLTVSGVFDIDDIILNVFGSVFGFTVYALSKKMLCKKVEV